jgi:hypothetical protein
MVTGAAATHRYLQHGLRRDAGSALTAALRVMNQNPDPIKTPPIIAIGDTY